MSNVLRLTGVTLPGTGYPTLKSFLDVTPRLPVTAGLLGLYYLRDSGGREIQNYISGGAPLIKVGSPALLENGAVCDPSNYYSMNMQARPQGTILAIAKPENAPANFGASIPVVSGYNAPASGSGNGDVLWCGTNFSGAGQVVGAAASCPGDGVTPQGSPAAYLNVSLPPAAPMAIFGTFTGAPDRHMVGMLPNPGGALLKQAYASGAPTFSRPPAAFGPPLRIGASPYSFTGQSTVMLVAYFNRVLTEAEIQQNLEYLRGEWGVQQGLWS